MIPIVQWFPNCEPRLPGSGFLLEEPRTITIFHNFFNILFQFADVDILQSILGIWSSMLICNAIICHVYESFSTRLHATKEIDTILKVQLVNLATTSAGSKKS